MNNRAGGEYASGTASLGLSQQPFGGGLQTAMTVEGSSISSSHGIHQHKKRLFTDDMALGFDRSGYLQAKEFTPGAGWQHSSLDWPVSSASARGENRRNVEQPAPPGVVGPAGAGGARERYGSEIRIREFTPGALWGDASATSPLRQNKTATGGQTKRWSGLVIHSVSKKGVEQSRSTTISSTDPASSKEAGTTQSKEPAPGHGIIGYVYVLSYSLLSCGKGTSRGYRKRMGMSWSTSYVGDAMSPDQ